MNELLRQYLTGVNGVYEWFADFLAGSRTYAMQLPRDCYDLNDLLSVMLVTLKFLTLDLQEFAKTKPLHYY